MLQGMRIALCRLWVLCVSCMLLAPWAANAWAQQPAGSAPANRQAANRQAAGQQTAGFGQATSAQQAGAAVPGAPQGEVTGVQKPFWADRQTPQELEWIDRVLGFWEQKSSSIKRFQCSFRRWEFDHMFGPKNTFKTFSEGTIKYTEPDKGSFKVEEHKVYEPPKAEGEKPQYALRKDHMEHWVSSGTSIFEFDYASKRLIERPLPPDMQGQAISQGPLPFIFRANKQDILSRFWVRNVTPPNTNEYHLEFFPKSPMTFKVIQIHLDQEEFLPLRLRLFESFSPARYTQFELHDRKHNGFSLDQLKFWERDFAKPKAPLGWEYKRIEIPQAPQQAANPKAGQPVRRQ